MTLRDTTPPEGCTCSPVPNLYHREVDRGRSEGLHYQQVQYVGVTQSPLEALDPVASKVPTIFWTRSERIQRDPFFSP